VRLLFLTPRYYPATGGVESLVRDLSRTLARDGHQVTVLAPIRATIDILPSRLSYAARYVSDEDDDGVRVVGLNPPPWARLLQLPVAIRDNPTVGGKFYDRLARLQAPLYCLANRPRIDQLAARADVVHVFGAEQLAALSFSATLRRGLPLVMTPFAHPGQWGDDSVTRAVCRRADVVVGLLPSECRVYQGWGVAAERLHTIGVGVNPIDTGSAAAFRAAHALGDAPVVLFVGRKESYKGYTTLLEAAPTVWASHPDARFVFLGPDTPESTETFAARREDPRVLNLGRVDEAAKAAALAACTLLALPSSSEIMPTVFLEAWSARRPVVAGDTPYQRELMDDGRRGLLAPPRDPAALATALLRLLDDAELRATLSDAGHNRYLTDHTFSSVSRQHLDLYDSLIEARGTARR